MPNERVDIVVTDKVSPGTAKKLRAIASEALKADSAIDRLRASINAVDDTALTRLTNASTKLTNAQARDTSATARLTNARAKMAGETSRAALASQKLATEQARTEAATERSAAAASRARSALIQEESASNRLAAAKLREASAQNVATGAANRAATASRRAARGAGLAAHQTQNLIFQVNDIVVGLASGQKPMTVLLQQGSQISTVFGPGTGVTGILRGLGGAVLSIAKQFAPVIIVVGVVAALFGALTYEIGQTTDVAVGMGDTFKAVMQLSAEAITSILGPAIAFIGPYVKQTWDFIVMATKFTVNNIIALFVGTFNALKVVWSDLPAYYETLWKTVFNGLIDVVGFGMNGIIDIFKGGINNTIAVFVGGFNAVIAVWGLLPAAFDRLGALAMNGMIDVVETGIKGIISAVDSLFTFIGSAAELVGLENPFANLFDASNINLDAYKSQVAAVGPGIAATIGDSFTDAFSREYTEGLKTALDISGFKQELSDAASSSAGAIEAAYVDAFSTDFAGGAFLAIRERSIKLARERIAAENEAETATGGSNAALDAKQRILQDILGPLIEYRTHTEALNELLNEGVISLGQYSQALASLSLVESLRDLDAGLIGTPFADAAALDEVRIAEQERLNIVQDALLSRIISEQEAADRIVAISRQASQDIQEIESARNSMILMGASDTFGSLADAAKGFAGEQSGIYKALFITSKAFAIADSIMKIQQGVANALSLPFPANLAAAGVVAANAASIVSSIQAVQFKKDGGEIFGPGGPRDDRVPIMASNKEFIVNARDAQRNLPLLRAINSGRDPQSARPAFRDGGQVQQAFRAPVSRSDIGSVGNGPDRMGQGNTTVNVFTRDPDTRIEVTNTQRAAATARAVNRGQRNL